MPVGRTGSVLHDRARCGFVALAGGGVAFFLAPTLWGSIYAVCVRAGQPPGFAQVGAGLVGAALPALIHRSISAEDWQPKTN